MAISMENSPLHDLPPGTHLYFSEEYSQYNQGGMVTSAVQDYEMIIDADGDLVALTPIDRMVSDWYEANWELGAMHCSGEDCDEAAF
jgi:hypothetical protein